MKTTKTSVFLLLFLILLFQDNFAQKRPSISICYNYLTTEDHDFGPINYPVGFGGSFSLPILKRLTFQTGLDYFHRQTYSVGEMEGFINKSFLVTGEQQLNSKYPVIIREKFNESLFLLNIGLSYTLIDKKLSIKIGGDLVPIYGHFIHDMLYQYHDSTETHYNNAKDVFKIGFNIRTKIEYSFFKRIAIYIEPVQTCYFSGRASYYYNRNTLYPGLQGSIGMTYYLK